LRTLFAGAALALLRRPRPSDLHLGAGTFFAATAITMALGIGVDFYAIVPPRQFQWWAFEGRGAMALVELFVAYLLAEMLAGPMLLWPLAALIGITNIYTDLIAHWVYDQLLAPWMDDHEVWSETAYWAYFAAMLLWWFAILTRILGMLAPERPAPRRWQLATAAVVVLGLASDLLPQTNFWLPNDADPNIAAGNASAPLVAEDIFGRQPALLEQALDAITPGVHGSPHLYFLAFAPDGSQAVFTREALYAQQLFEQRFDAAGRTLVLANSRDHLNDLPLASASNLAVALNALGARMGPDDILFLFLTSHGGRDATLSVQLGDLGFEEFSADGLAQMLRDAGVRWKVIVISSCYSGSFIPALRDADTMIITAARADRTSFGCSDTADFTYFGRAYFEQALNQTRSFKEAYVTARTLIERWENEDQSQHSEPQLFSDAAIEATLAEWQSGIGRPTAPVISTKAKLPGNSRHTAQRH